jgi:hypothetical protein
VRWVSWWWLGLGYWSLVRTVGGRTVGCKSVWCLALEACSRCYLGDGREHLTVLSMEAWFKPSHAEDATSGRGLRKRSKASSAKTRPVSLASPPPLACRMIDTRTWEASSRALWVWLL